MTNTNTDPLFQKILEVIKTKAKPFHGGALRNSDDLTWAIIDVVRADQGVGPITEEEALRLGKVAWVAHNGGGEWARSVVDDCFSPADDLPEEALDMIAVARAVLEAADDKRNSA